MNKSDRKEVRHRIGNSLYPSPAPSRPNRFPDPHDLHSLSFLMLQSRRLSSGDAELTQGQCHNASNPTMRKFYASPRDLDKTPTYASFTDPDQGHSSLYKASKGQTRYPGKLFIKA